MKHITRKLTALFTVFLLVFCFSTAVFAADGNSDYTDSAGNCFFGDEDTVQDNASFFGGFGAGRNLTVRNASSEDALTIAGMNLNVSGSRIGGSLFAAGYDISISDTTVEGNIAAAANSITLDAETSANAVLVTGRTVTMNGTAKAFSASAETVIINGEIDGDAAINANRLIIGDNAKITGILKAAVPEDPEISGEASIRAIDVDITAPEEDSETASSFSLLDELGSRARSFLYWMTAMLLIALVLVLLFAGTIYESCDLIRSRFWVTVFSGAAVLLSIPLAVLLICITFIGLPLGLITLALYILLICASTAITGTVLGTYFIRKGHILLRALAGIAALELLKQIPYLGILVSFCSVLITFGILAQLIRNHRRPMGGRVRGDVLPAPADPESH